MKILIAEDDMTSRVMLEGVLSKRGYEVVSVVDGNQACEAMRQTTAPQLAILDWMMPKMDGIDVCRKFRQMETTTPIYIILLTARGSKKDIVEGLEAGADDYIAKPFDIDELHARINAGFRIIKLQTALAEKEKLQGVIEMAGAVCHELNQPLQMAAGIYDLLMLDEKNDSPIYEKIKNINKQIHRMGEITGRLMRITKYETKDYFKGKIIDIDKAAG